MLFSAPMIRALLDGRKTQTRRICTHRHGINFLGGEGEQDDPSMWGYSFDGPDHNGYMVLGRGLNETHNHGLISIPSPYGEVGDSLWVRETHATFAVGNRTKDAPQCVAYRATCDADGGFDYVNNGDEVMRLKVTKWTPSIFMPRWASRIQLEVTGVRVERLQAIGEEDAVAEGVEATTYESWTAYDPRTEGYPAFLVKPDAHDSIDLSTVRHHVKSTSAVENYRRLWDGINGARADWASNCWVWVVSFRLVRP